MRECDQVRYEFRRSQLAERAACGVAVEDGEQRKETDLAQA